MALQILGLTGFFMVGAMIPKLLALIGDDSTLTPSHGGYMATAVSFIASYFIFG